MRLPPLPAGYTATRTALHRVAEEVVAPARRAATGHEISLRALPGGFGAPALAGGTWVRVDGVEIVRPDGSREPVAGADPESAAVLARVFAFAAALLDALRDGEQSASTPVLWPEHFDLAMTLGEANYGVSPGGETHPEPYVYVGPWTEPAADERLWNAEGFPGAELGWSQLLDLPDPHATALAWMRERRDALASPT